MIPDKMLDVLKHEGVVSIVSNGQEVHVVNTWNSYLTILNKKLILIPVGGMNTTQENLEINNKVLMTLGSREVDGFRGLGTGFLIEGNAYMLEEGNEFDLMKEKFFWMRAVLIVEINKIEQTL